MKWFFGIAAIVAAIILGPLVTDALRDDRSTLDRRIDDLDRSMQRLDEVSR